MILLTLLATYRSEHITTQLIIASAIGLHTNMYGDWKAWKAALITDRWSGIIYRPIQYTIFMIFISDEEDDDDADSVNSDARDASETEAWANTSTHTTPPANGEDQLKAAATPIEFNLNGPTTSASEGGKATSTSTINVITNKEDRQPSDLAKLLMLHHQYGHISMQKMQEMATQGTIPKRLATCRIPTCLACL